MLADFQSNRFCQRLEGLAANQDILVKANWRGADLQDIARAHLSGFTDLTSERIHISGPSLILNSNAAQAIGMAFHIMTVCPIVRDSAANITQPRYAHPA